MRAHEADLGALKQVYKELEFYSLLKELGPGEDTRARDYAGARIRSDARASGCARFRADAPVAVAIAKSGRRR